MKTAKRVYRWLLGIVVAAALLVDAAAIVVALRETNEIAVIAASLSSPGQQPSEAMRRVAAYVAHEVPSKRVNAAFLLPVFEPLKPTALQVIRGGGDCAYKARAFIVLLHQMKIPASKLALYDPKGNPVHAAALVETERGDYVVDLLFGVVYERADGSPILLEELRTDRQVMYDALDRAVTAGNEKAERYPRERFVYDTARTINWHKNALTASIYNLGVSLFGADRMNNLRRPYFSEEPSQMVVLLCSGGAFLFALPAGIGALRGWRARRRAIANSAA
jgi:hypothetical protein